MLVGCLRLRYNVAMLIRTIKLRLSNAYIVHERPDRPPILVDTGSEGDLSKIEEALADLGYALRDIALILHTHIHSDHVGSTTALLEEADVPVAFHAADQPFVDRGDNGLLTGTTWRGQLMTRFFKVISFDAPAASFYVEDGMRLDEYGVAGQIVHTPGHTAGSISLVLDSGEAIIGDLLMGGFMGGNMMPNRPNLHYFADELSAVRPSVEKLLALPIQTCYVGHGGPLKVDDIRQSIGRLFG